MKEMKMFTIFCLIFATIFSSSSSADTPTSPTVGANYRIKYPQRVPGHDLQPYCGVKPFSPLFIIGAFNTKEKKWPWQAVVDFEYYNNRGHYCSGSIISDQWILSAAHCFSDYPIRSLYTITLGEHNIKKRSGQEKVFNVSELIMHPKYDPITLDYDIALVRLDRKITFNEYIHPICLPDESIDFQPGTNCYVAGWGISSRKNGIYKAANILQETQVPLATLHACNKTYGTESYIRKGYKVTSRMLCTGTANGTRDPCNGDSGGPLMCKKNFGYDVWYVWGTVSWGDGCARKDYFTAYGNVRYFRRWIEGIVFDSKLKKVVMK